MKISIITVTYNASAFIETAIQSVLSQTYTNIEYIVIDGASKDDTMCIVNRYSDKISYIVSEPDKGIYDAMNKGIALASGDIVGILNADDYYPNDQVLAGVAKKFTNNPNVDVLLGSIAFVADKDMPLQRVVNALKFKPSKLKRGWMPPHPGSFLRNYVYDNVGCYKTDYKIAADYEFFIRVLLKEGYAYKTTSEILVYMRTGGASTSGWSSQSIITQEIVRALAENGYKASYWQVLLRLPIKFITQVLFK